MKAHHTLLFVCAILLAGCRAQVTGALPVRSAQPVQSATHPAQLEGTDYYISATGSDSNSGVSSDKAWATLAKASSIALGPGDRLLLEGNKVFCGTLELDADSHGSEEKPVVITSYGEGRAIIYGGHGDALRIVETSNVAIENLTVIGSGPKLNRQGSGVLVRRAANITVDNVEASGFQHAGIFIDESRDVRVTKVYAHDNGFSGIMVGGTNDISRNIYVGYCRALNNPGHPNVSGNISGSGIFFYMIDGGLIEYCEAAYNGWDMEHVAENGPVGIWAARARNVVIQHCVSHDNKSTKGDGGGFDFDSGSHDCLMQYNYSYGNSGCGFLLCPYTDAPEDGLSNCTIRFCVSENDGQKDHKANVFIYNGANQRNMQIYNNVFYNDAGRSCVASRPALPDSFVFRNNLFITRGTGPFVRGIGEAVFQGNAYWNPDGPGNWDGESSLQAWREKSGHELLDGEPVGMFADPQLTAPGRGEKLTDPKSLPLLKAYSVLDWSPLIGAGLDLRAHFGIDTGAHDFFGNEIPAEGPWCVGADTSTGTLKAWRDEYNAQTGEIPAEWKAPADPLPALGPWVFRADPENVGLEESWFQPDVNPDGWTPVKVPAFWGETRAVGNYQGIGWYRTSLTVPADWKGRGAQLLFAAVDEEAWVYVNGNLVREHSVKSEGKSIGILWEEPFTGDIPPEMLNYAQPNVLVVRVNNSAGNGGIWRPVLGRAMK